MRTREEIKAEIEAQYKFEAFIIYLMSQIGADRIDIPEIELITLPSKYVLFARRNPKNKSFTLEVISEVTNHNHSNEK